MIKTETLENGYIKTYSDEGFYIHGGFPEGDYAQAIDRQSLIEHTQKLTDILTRRRRLKKRLLPMTFLWEVLLVNRTNYFLDKAKRLRPIIENCGKPS